VTAGGAGSRAQPWALYLTVVLASGCTLVLELVAGRILAPFVGVSIQTWTSVIGVVLAGISLGNYLGGALADRASSDRTLGVLLAAGGLASLAVLPLTGGAGALAPRSLPLLVRIVLLTIFLFFVPSVVLGMIPPVAVKCALRDLDRTGQVVGRMYAASTAGSLGGAFLTGFILIAHFGTRAIVLGVGLALLALGAVAAALASDAPRNETARA
jgi:predicted MFS family arabinose efflux permease